MVDLTIKNIICIIIKLMETLYIMVQIIIMEEQEILKMLENLKNQIWMLIVNLDYHGINKYLNY